MKILLIISMLFLSGCVSAHHLSDSDSFWVKTSKFASDDDIYWCTTKRIGAEDKGNSPVCYEAKVFTNGKTHILD